MLPKNNERSRHVLELEALSDRQLLERIGSMLGSSRRLMAELIAHLGEVEERRLHLAAACSSMFAYCLKLGMTEDEAYRRIEVARLARKYPAIFRLLADGQLTISAVTLLKHHLSQENHLDLLATVEGKSVVQTRELVAAQFPRPDVASSVRKLPERRTMMQPSLAMAAPTEPNMRGTAPTTNRTPLSTVDTAEPANMTTLESAGADISTRVTAILTSVTTLDTAGARGHHRGELTRASASSYIARSTRRTVVERDGLGCSWVDEQGVRCGSRTWLEYDHRRPRAKGGGSEPDNLRLLCRNHNRFAAE